MNCVNSEPSINLQQITKKKRKKFHHFSHSEISYDLVNSQMNTEIINKQMDFNEAEIPFFPFYTNNIFSLLIFYAILRS